MEKRIRFTTREVMVGNVGIGAGNPIRIQSMTNTNTLDTQATVEQILRLGAVGCEMVRLAVPGVREAYHLEKIKDRLAQLGCSLPLIADVHFSPKAALIAAAIADKVRVNPGNYSDRNTGKTFFSDKDQQLAVARIKERMGPLIEVCKMHGTALRIGSNHGSISERIISTYGNTPQGMVEAALEFVDVCRQMDYHQLVLSMKASSVRIMVFANRLLVKRMINENFDYPIHLGVTEAGDAAEGRIKSAVGIGALLADGIGDTIRVSLTEKPENEIPVAKKICAYVAASQPHTFQKYDDHFHQLPHDATRPIVSAAIEVFNQKPPLVVNHKSVYQSTRPDIELDFNEEIPNYLHYINGLALMSVAAFSDSKAILFSSKRIQGVYDFKEVLRLRDLLKPAFPVILKKLYHKMNFDIDAAIDFGIHFIDNKAQGLMIDAESDIPKEELVNLSLQILQAAGARKSRTEYIACPSCGRTQYDIQTSLQEIKKRTSHLPGLKIAVMGCIVNGPGEMADADYGYIGMGAGKVALFKGKTCVRKNVPENEAVVELVALIRENGDWMDPPQITSA